MRFNTGMPESTPVLMISAGMLRPKKAGNAFASWHRYLNYGLLGLATRLSAAGYRPRVFHGHFEQPEAFVERIANAGWLQTRAPVLLSVPSSYALDWARRASRDIKERAPSTKILVGGRWVVGKDGAWVRRQIPDADLVVFGLADELVESLMRPASWRTQRNNDLSLFPQVEASADQVPGCLDYTLLDEREQFTPSFEVSRGCGRGCSFCAEALVGLSGMKGPTALADEIEACYAAYGHRESRAFFEASMFSPSTSWVDACAAEFAGRGVRLKWRTETRVDNMPARQVEKLAQMGMRVLDLGLESASHEQLRRMGKTSKPETYLRKASDLLRACHDAGVWTKVNVLLYPGETKSTLSETEEWLDKNARLVKGVSAGPLILYRYGDATDEYLTEIRAHGAAPTNADDLELKGFADLHLSPTMSHADSAEAARRVSRSMMTARDYFDLKAFSYFRPSLTFEEFMDHVRQQDERTLPFRCEGGHLNTGRQAESAHALSEYECPGARFAA
jgi:hypothetical protein